MFISTHFDYRMSLIWPQVTSFGYDRELKLTLPMGCADKNNKGSKGKTRRSRQGSNQGFQVCEMPVLITPFYTYEHTFVLNHRVKTVGWR